MHRRSALAPLSAAVWTLWAGIAAPPMASAAGREASGSGSARAWALASTTWIWEQATTASRRLGYLRGGQEVPLRAPLPEPVPGQANGVTAGGVRPRVEARGTQALAASEAPSLEGLRGAGCRSVFWAVAPRGYVCADDLTREASHPVLRALQLALPRPGAAPFDYAFSNGAPIYERLPSPAEAAEVERWLGPPGTFATYPWHANHTRLAEVRELPFSGPVPSFLVDGGSLRGSRLELAEQARGSRMSAGSRLSEVPSRRMIQLGSMLAYNRVFEHDGRRWLLTSDGSVVPADRVRPFRRSAFHGVQLGGEWTLPLAWTRGSPAQVWVEDGSGRLVASGRSVPVRTPLAVAGELAPLTRNQVRYLPLRELAGGRRQWVERAEVVVVEAEARLPVRVSAADTWLDVSVTQGTLVAYEGLRPVFATLVSPGTGGVSSAGRDAVRASTTPRGTFRIQYKYLTQTMSPDKGKPDRERSFWIDEVPHAQYFSIPFALHAAYWHESFGEWMSAGCINLSLEDAAWLFRWTSPHLPQGWYSVWAGGPNGPGTFVVVRR